MHLPDSSSVGRHTPCTYLTSSSVGRHTPCTYLTSSSVGRHTPCTYLSTLHYNGLIVFTNRNGVHISTAVETLVRSSSFIPVKTILQQHCSRWRRRPYLRVSICW